MTQQGPACCRDSSQENESKFNAASLRKVLWDAPTMLLCTRAGGDGAGTTAREGGRQAALLWAGLCPASFCWELESKGEGKRSQAAGT